MYSRGGVSQLDASKTHLSDIYHLETVRSVEYISLLLGHSKTSLGEIVLDGKESTLILHRKALIDGKSHCEELSKLGNVDLLITLDGLPSVSNKLPYSNANPTTTPRDRHLPSSAYLQIGLQITKKEMVFDVLNGGWYGSEQSPHPNADPLFTLMSPKISHDAVPRETFIATEIDHDIFWSVEGIVKSKLSVLKWERCVDYFSSARLGVYIRTHINGQVNSSFYKTRFDQIYALYDFTIQDRAVTLIYLVITSGCILSAGTWAILFKMLKKDRDIMISNKIKREMGVVSGVSWKRIERDVFRPPVYRFLYIGIISNGTFILASGLFGLIFCCILPLLERSAEKDLFFIMLIILIGSVSQGICMASMREQLYPIGKKYLIWKNKNICIKGIVKFLLYIPIVLGALLGTIMYHSKWHIMKDGDTVYTYGTRVVVPAIALFSVSILAVISGSACPCNLIKHPSRAGERASLLDDLGGSIIPKESGKTKTSRYIFSYLFPIIVTIPPFWIHYKIIYETMWIGIFEIKLMGFSMATFLISWIAFAACNVGSCYLMLQSGNHNWWWPVLHVNGLTVAATAVFLIFCHTLPFALLVNIICLGNYVLFLSTIAFYSRYFFIRYIYFSIKCD